MVLLKTLRIRNFPSQRAIQKWQQVPAAALHVRAGFVGPNTHVVENEWTLRAIFNKVTTKLSEILRFSDDSEVPELSSDNFHSYVKSSKRTLVMWYDPFCPVCRRSYVEFERFYQMVRGSLACGAINASENEDLARSQGIAAFPTFRLYVCNGRCSYKSYEGGLTASQMSAFVREFSYLDANLSSCMTKSAAQTKTAQVSIAIKHFFAPSNTHIIHRFVTYELVDNCIKQFTRHLSFSSVSSTISHVPRMVKIGKTNLVITQNVMEINGANFKEKINSFENVLVLFYTTWCNQCGESMNQFMKAAELIGEDVGVLALCNGEDSLEIVDKYYVGKIPTLKYFRRGRYVTDYIGDVTTELIVKFMKEPHIDEEFLLMVTKHKPHGDLHVSEVFTPTQKKMMWEGNNGLIVEVTTDNVETVIKENGSLLLLFYACWNRICVGLRHDYLTVAKAVEKSDVVLAACDCEEHVEVADKFLITKFPTIKYLKNGVVVRDFNGHWHSESILEFLQDPSKLQVIPKDGKRPKPQQMEDEGTPDYWKGVEGGDKILHFTDFNFKKLMNSNPAVLIMFYVTWCKSCTPLKREIGKAATQLSKDVGMLASCDAERNNEMADRFSIIKLPTMKYFKNGAHVSDYTGRRTAADIIAFMNNPRVAKVLPPLADFKRGPDKNYE
ncbi:hypothetical protein GE061_013748 [Apolygus lucorum]|uniref:Thioredoxin domain-containing protein n=1 Tax=Apolygus lucorum TaxID=248454 RepID=A0A8S9XQQ2_APOLU|nr:hypothetical protein GE061_013748 [Apolygus lucorum]